MIFGIKNTIKSVINSLTDGFERPCLFSFFSDFLFIYSFYNTYFITNGVFPDQIAILVIIIQITKLLCDIPAGLFADIISRRNLVIIGLFARCLFCVICIFSHTFILFAIACVVYGFSMSCIYSRVDAYFYDMLKKDNNENKFPVFMGKYYAFSNIAIGSAGLLSGNIFSIFGFDGIFLCTILSLLIAIVILMCMPNYKPIEDTAHVFHVRNPMRLSVLIKQMLKKPNILRLIFFSMLIDGLFLTFIDINTTLMNVIGFSAQKVAEIVGFVGIIRIFTNYFSGRLEKIMTFKCMQSVLFIFMCLSIFFSFHGGDRLVGIVSCYMCIYPFFDTSIKTKIQKRIDSNTRATVMSFVSLGASLSTIFFNFLVAYIANANGYFMVIFAISCVVIVVLSMIRNLMQFYRIDSKIRKFLGKRLKKII